MTRVNQLIVSCDAGLYLIFLSISAFTSERILGLIVWLAVESTSSALRTVPSGRTVSLKEIVTTSAGRPLNFDKDAGYRIRLPDPPMPLSIKFSPSPSPSPMPVLGITNVRRQQVACGRTSHPCLRELQSLLKSLRQQDHT